MASTLFLFQRDSMLQMSQDHGNDYCVRYNTDELIGVIININKEDTYIKTYNLVSSRQLTFM